MERRVNQSSTGNGLGGMKFFNHSPTGRREYVEAIMQQYQQLLANCRYDIKKSEDADCFQLAWLKMTQYCFWMVKQTETERRVIDERKKES